MLQSRQKIVTNQVTRCKLCPKLIEEVKKVNNPQSSRDHLNQIHPEVQELNETKSAQQLRLSSTGQDVTTKPVIKINW